MNFDFALLLVVLTAVTGVLWLADRLLLAPARRRRAAALENMTSLPAAERKTRAEEALREPVVTEYARSFFPVLLLILAVPLVPRRAVQDSVGLDDADAAGRRFHPRQQVRLRPAPAGAQHQDPGGRRAQARRRLRVPLSGEPERGLHQARDRPARRRDHLPQQDALHQRQGNHRELPRARTRDRRSRPTA